MMFLLRLEFHFSFGTQIPDIFNAVFGCSENCTADMDGNDAVGVSDLGEFLGVFGAVCE